MGLGKIEKLLATGRETHAGDAPAAESDERLAQLESVAERIPEGIEKGEDPGDPVVGGQHSGHKERNADRRQEGEVLETRPTQEDHRRPDDHQQGRRSEIGLEIDQAGEKSGTGERQQQGAEGVGAPDGEQMGKRYHQPEPGRLGGLQGEAGDLHPAVHPVDRRRQQGGEERHDDRPVHRPHHGRTIQEPVVRTGDRDHRQAAQCGPDRLAAQKVGGAAVAGVRHDGRGAVEHDQPKDEQPEREEEERQVGSHPPPRHRRPPWAASRRATSARNRVPRSA